LATVTLPLFDGFPREIGKNRKVVRTKEDFIRFIDLHNGKQSLYTTLYHFEKLRKPWRCEYETAIIDKLMFDLDSEEAYEDVMKSHDYYSRENIFHRVEFTGGGYQFFAYGEIIPLDNPKGMLYNASIHYEKQIKIEVDPKCRGDAARICRIYNTFNVKRRKFSIPCSLEMLKEGDRKIREMARKQVRLTLNEWLLGGPGFINFAPFDEEKKINMQLPDGLDYDTDIPESVILAIKCPALQILTNDSNLGYDGRYLVILYLKESGKTPGEVITFLKSFLSPRKFYHCVHEERAVNYIFRRHDFFMPTKETLRKRGICRYNCKECHLEDLYFDK
jgi:hypothetical protein